MTLIRFFFFLGATFIFTSLQSQNVGDTLVPLRNNAQIMQQFTAWYGSLPASNQRNQIINSGGNLYIFRIDTLHLPFIDDFSRNLQKKYQTNALPPGTTTIIDDDFKVDGIYVDTLEAMYDTSYTYTFNSNTNSWDSTANSFLQVVFYEDPIFVNIPTDTDTVWIRPSGSIVNNTFIPNNIQADTIYYNRADTLFNVPDDNRSIWINHYAHVNNTFGLNPPTIGVATFDGLGLNGEPYSNNLVNPNAYGGADTLTSKPLFLKNKPVGGGIYNNSDSLYLSFFYQPEGLGERPDPQDSLVLEFYSPTQAQWNKVWFANGEPLKNFEQVLVPINDTNYFQNGFQFRFRNRATITGNLDHWNIDYVRLDDNRSNVDTDLDDVAFVNAPPSLINDYTEIPWSHYKDQPLSNMKSEVETEVRNNSTVAKLVNFSFQVEEQASNIYVSGLTVVPNFFEKTQITQPYDLENFVFPSTSTDTAYAYTVKYVLNTTPDINRNNDTAFFYQQFKSAYAYDDGSAENSYSLVSAGAELAYQFTPVINQDSLRGVYMYFPKVYENVTDLPFQIKVWSSLEPENVIYESTFNFATYTPERDLFTRFEFEEAVAIDGQFYIGFEQRDRDDIYIGFDVNNNNQDKIFYNVGNGWTGTLNEGSLMIRPDFGKGYNPYPVGTDEAFEDTSPLKVYPNPARDVLQIELENRTGQLKIFSLSGAIMFQSEFSERSSVPLVHWSKGIYFLQIIDQNGKNHSQKIVVQ